jgi:hypothetical protein
MIKIKMYLVKLFNYMKLEEQPILLLKICLKLY